MMTLEELKKELGIPLEDTSRDEQLSVLLTRAIDFAKTYCRNDFADGLPEGVKAGVSLLVKARIEGNVQSQTLGDMNKTFFPSTAFEDAKKYFKPYKKARFI